MFAWITTRSQENSITLSGGYAFANIEDIDEGTSGWRINLLYEYTPYGGHFSHGIAFGFIRTEKTVAKSGDTDSEFKAGHWPVYYAPKYAFGKNAFRPFVKGAVGWHFSDYDKTGPLGGQVDSGDSGFYGGLGAGLMVKPGGDKVLVNLEYEWAYLGNSFYKDGFINSIMLGIGIMF